MIEYAVLRLFRVPGELFGVARPIEVTSWAAVPGAPRAAHKHAKEPKGGQV